MQQGDVDSEPKICLGSENERVKALSGACLDHEYSEPKIKLGLEKEQDKAETDEKKNTTNL